MLKILKSKDRGHFNHGWLETFHSFSFADYYNPDAMGFRDLRVINEDVIAPGEGFDTHPHRDMEIITYILSGSLEHKDSLGSAAVIGPGDVQYMSAGRGVQHSEFNASKTQPVHLLQIWILPEKKGIQPVYGDRHFLRESFRNRLQTIASGSGVDDSIVINQKIKIMATVLDTQNWLKYEPQNGGYLWVQVAKGNVAINEQNLEAGDAVALTGESALNVKAITDAELLVFDLK